ncbi:acyl-CoA--6-aminopenicillanic acid acyltransferase [Antarcticibacterium flavum]|uniref:Acyl-CoA--6-aminopenicillanic acid acyltransferase n=1 Tax=Antarcticibacterium flavum TaxID=2058175 RepID=A0A5B7X8E8_9FLAO|nr:MULTISPECIES: C45 family peptidase [Antarcticibacterium]MCM4159671.1 acyl-CoA--6-aminopenicillanic acid acyltransferase [Antarcticibacterium sp. W02-3]QCY70911.1 acyl-CoA--6-aminopenicillanic acid acyltransferase [Antarcticibacterium flavum]
MQLQFNAVFEQGKPGAKWLKLYKTHWPAYRSWLNSKGTSNYPDLKTSQAALKKYMPEMWPVYQRLCKLANTDEVAARFLTGWQPPAYISACSQAVITGKEIQLVRNYDYHPNLMEGTQLFSSWNGKKVIATGDCLIGAVDGMNEDGLAVSLTFGGRKEVGVGFGIPFIIRYVLEFCSNVEEAVKVLTRIPSHMSYNVTVVDRSGAFKTIELAPDKAPLVTDAAFTTNHQGTVDWPENAAFNQTLERAAYLKKLLAGKGVNATKIADSFLKTPLYNTKFTEGFGTLFTSVYRPLDGTVELRWRDNYMQQSFDNFEEQKILVDYNQPAVAPTPWTYKETPRPAAKEVTVELKQKESAKFDWEVNVTEILVNSMSQANPGADKKQLEKLKGKILRNGEVSWEAVASFWTNVGTGYGASGGNY